MTSSKEGVLEEIDKEWEQLEAVLAQVRPERMEEAGVVEAWSTKDLIGHVTTWEHEAVESIRHYLPDRSTSLRRRSVKPADRAGARIFRFWPLGNWVSGRQRDRLCPDWTALWRH